MWTAPQAVKRRRKTVALSVGSFDPTGAAGVTMDLRVYAELGVDGAAAIVAVTAQNSARVASLTRLDATTILRQLNAVYEQARPNALCIGLLPTAQAIGAVAGFVGRMRPSPPIVLDPVASASSGYRFLDLRAQRALGKMLGLATVVVPNASEAALLTGMGVRTPEQAKNAALELSRHGCAALVTGGHLRWPRCVDVLVSGGRVQCFESNRLRKSMRGAGGILAAALTAYLARGRSLRQAVVLARRFVHRAFTRAMPLGKGRAQYLG